MFMSTQIEIINWPLRWWIEIFVVHFNESSLSSGMLLTKSRSSKLDGRFVLMRGDFYSWAGFDFDIASGRIRRIFFSWFNSFPPFFRSIFLIFNLASFRFPAFFSIWVFLSEKIGDDVADLSILFLIIVRFKMKPMSPNVKSREHLNELILNLSSLPSSVDTSPNSSRIFTIAATINMYAWVSKALAKISRFSSLPLARASRKLSITNKPALKRNRRRQIDSRYINSQQNENTFRVFARCCLYTFWSYC